MISHLLLNKVNLYLQGGPTDAGAGPPAIDNQSIFDDFIAEDNNVKIFNTNYNFQIMKTGDFYFIRYLPTNNINLASPLSYETTQSSERYLNYLHNTKEWDIKVCDIYYTNHFYLNIKPRYNNQMDLIYYDNRLHIISNSELHNCNNGIYIMFTRAIE